MPLLLYWPTVLWALGYVGFWGYTLGLPLPLGLSVWLSLLVFAGALFANRRWVTDRLKTCANEVRVAPLLFKGLLGIAAIIVVIAAFESRHPPHLIQEGDAMVYHMSIPRQHLLSRTPGMLSWSIADLFPMALQWGFAPAWFMNALPTKWPQTACAIWTLILMISLGRRYASANRPYLGWLPGLAFITAHGVTIQLGTAMMDLPILYCAVGAWHAARSGRWYWSALHLAMFATAKSFSPPQTVLVLGFAAALMLATRSTSLREIFRGRLLPATAFVLLSFALLSRSAFVSAKVAGTPLFPFFVCADAGAPGCQGSAGNHIRESARQHLGTRDAYGNGRGFSAFIQHAWRVAVPTQGVNNEFDYPLGLPWLLGVLFMVVAVARSVRRRDLTAEWAFGIAFWAVWWMGSQQARWLYPAVAFAWLGTIALQRLVNPRLLLAALFISAGFSLVSQTRSLKSFLFTPSGEINKRQEGALGRNEEGSVTDLKTLYATDVIREHAGLNPLWIIPPSNDDRSQQAPDRKPQG